MYQPVNGAGGSGTCGNKAGGSSGRREGLWKNSHGAEEPLRKGWFDSGTRLLTVRKEGCTPTRGQGRAPPATSESSGQYTGEGGL